MTERDIFIAALQKEDPGQRRAYLEEACAGQPELREQVETLLRLNAGAGRFLESPAVDVAPTGSLPESAAAAMSETPGSMIGSYMLIEQIGEGGMGTVWMAQQTEPIRRVVALKVIRAGMDSRQVIARFEAERQALALMEHTSIAKVLDAATTEGGRPYFAMELVKGRPITKYCDEHHLTPPQRLELFILVCQAVQHAHQKGIIHRDLKPSNVLVALYDGRAVPKVIDFGVAKATAQRLTEKTLVTGYGDLVGTPEYMSPEQAKVNELDVDTRSDVYSLGVLLYELLAGSPPFSRKDLEKAGMMEMLRVIREQEPSKPSTRLSSAEGLPTLAANRGMEPAKLTKLVRGELDWIVMKALEKDRDRRYETANGFAMDVQRYLADEPVEACPPSTPYRLKKLVRRNKGPVLATGLVFLTLIVGIVGTTWGLIGAREAKAAETKRAEEAQTRLTQVERGAAIMASVFRDVGPKVEDKEGVTLRVLLGRRLAEAASQVEGEAVGDPLVVARLLHLLGSSLGELGHAAQAEDALVRALQTRERLLAADDLDILNTKHSLAQVYWEQGKNSQAETLGKEVVEARVTRQGADHLDTLRSKNNLGLVYMSQRRLALAEQMFKDAVEGRTARLGADAQETLNSKSNLAGVYRKTGDNARAETLLNEVVAASTKARPNSVGTNQYKNNLADLYESQEKYVEAEKLFIEVVAGHATQLGPAHRLTLTAKNNLAAAYARRRKYAEAEALFKAVLDAQIATLVVDHRDTVTSKENLAFVYKAQEKYAAAEQMYREALTVYRVRQPAFWETYLLESVLGACLLGQQKYVDAEAHLVQGYQGLKKALGSPGQEEVDPHARRHLTEALERVVKLYEATNKLDEAAKWRKELEKMKEKP